MKDILPGDRMPINFQSLIESLPMVCPNLNGYKASFDFYFEPWSNIYSWMDNNTRLSTQEHANRQRYYYRFGRLTSSDNTQFPLGHITSDANKPGSLFDYLGVPVGFFGLPTTSGDGDTIPMNFPAEKLISYLDIVRNYYVNEQEGYAYFVKLMVETRVGDRFTLGRISIPGLDRVLQALRSEANGSEIVSTMNSYSMPSGAGYNSVGAFINDLIESAKKIPLGGLFLRTYRMDLNRGIMNQSVGEFKSTVNVTDGQFSIDTLRFANKMQKFIDRIDISGGRFSDMMRARWGVTPRGTMNIPDYLGSCSEMFGVTDVLATASGQNSQISGDRGNSVLGQQAGFAVARCNRSNSPISLRADQYGTLVCMFSLVPIVTYSQGVEIEDQKTKFSQIYDPAFAQLGYQDVSPREFSVFPEITSVGQNGVQLNTATPLAENSSVGKRIAFSEYMAGLPRAHGYFAYGESLDYWVNNRLYTSPNTLEVDDADIAARISRYGETDYTTYINPAMINNLFVDTSPTAQNFRLRVVFDINARRNIGSRVMPHL